MYRNRSAVSSNENKNFCFCCVMNVPSTHHHHHQTLINLKSFYTKPLFYVNSFHQMVVEPTIRTARHIHLSTF
jgi:hypothetical protein